MGETGTSSEDPYNYKLHFRQYLHNPATLDLMFLKLEDVETVTWGGGNFSRLYFVQRRLKDTSVISLISTFVRFDLKRILFALFTQELF